MKPIPPSCVASWNKHSSIWIPHAIDTVCPFCGKLATLVFSLTVPDPNSKTACGVARCARCGSLATIVVVEPSMDDGEKLPKELFIHPSPTGHRISILGTTEVHERLDNAYKAALDSYNAGIWAASVTMCRRMLEGLVKLQLPEAERGGSLAAQLKKLPDHVDLRKPFLDLAGVLKDGGNIGAHFDLDREPDQEFATLVLELTEYILEYLFIVPKHSETLRASIEKLEQ